MSIAISFRPTGMSRTKYDSVIQRLNAAGAGKPPGRLYHACFGDDPEVRVFDVWSDMASFERFGATLVPILAEYGIDVGAPDVQPLHNVIVG